MRDFKGMKRQRSRNRNGGGGGGGQGGKPQHNTNRAFDSNGPEGVKVRGAAQHVYEKYQQLARDAQTSGDRVLAENYLQHAEHYFRLMRAMQPQRPLSEIIGRDQFVSGYDIDFEDESGGEAVEGESEAESGEGQENRSGEYRRDDRVRDDYRSGDGRSREDSPRQERIASERPQGDRYASDRPQPDRSSTVVAPERAPGEQGRDDRSARGGREERPRFNRDERTPRYESEKRDPMTITEPEATPLVARPGPGEGGGVLRADDGDVSDAPAFLQVRPSAARGDGSDESRPRRRRAPASFEPSPEASESAESD